jgi:cobyrinic acid a,c-diamide synthase
MIPPLFASPCGEQADIALIEGNKGLYDGMDLEGANSNAALAKLVRPRWCWCWTPMGMTRGIAPLILGYQAFDRDVNIAGVILNKVGGPRHEEKLRAVIERYTDVRVLGAVRMDPNLAIVERHLGLMPGNESEAAETRVEAIAARIADQVDLDARAGDRRTGPLPSARFADRCG